MSIRTLVALAMFATAPVLAAEPSLAKSIDQQYELRLGKLFDHFHRHPELSFMEVETAKRLAAELREAGFTVTEQVGGTGVVALLKNGPGPMVMMRSDMDGLPVEEKSGLPNASTVKGKDREGNTFPVMHACGHDVHMTSLVGTARIMAANKDRWSGTLMLIGQPAEERVGGADAMMKDHIWERFGKPDYALALHVLSDIEAGKVVVVDDAAWSGSDFVDIIVHGVGAHGAFPHMGKDPIVMGSEIVMMLQTIISREKAPRESGVITVGTFQAGTKNNIIGDRATLGLTVRSESEAARQAMLSAIKRVAVNTGRAAGMPEDKLPEVIYGPSTPPTLNDAALAQRVRAAMAKAMGQNIFMDGYKRLHMGAEDFPYFTRQPAIPSVYFAVGGTPKAALEAEKRGGPGVPSNHSPLFKAEAETAIKTGIEATVAALTDLMPRK